MKAAPAMLDVRRLARDLQVQPVDLVRQLVADGIAVLPVSDRVYRVDASAYEAWRERRRQQLADRFQQAERRADHVQGESKPKRRAAFTR